MNHGQASANAFVSICSRNPIAVLAISDFLTKSSFRWGVMKFVTGSLPVTSHGLQIAACRRVFNTGMARTGRQVGFGRMQDNSPDGRTLGFHEVQSYVLCAWVSSGIVRLVGKFDEQLGDAIATVAAGHIYVKDDASDRCRRGFELRRRPLGRPRSLFS